MKLVKFTVAVLFSPMFIIGFVFEIILHMVIAGSNVADRIFSDF